jgi:hypothetical protein
MRDWTIAVAHSTVNLLVQYFKIWLYNNLDMFTYLTKHSGCFLVSSQIKSFQEIDTR